MINTLKTLPADILSTLANVVLGNEDATIAKATSKRFEFLRGFEKNGIVGSILAVVSYLSQSVSRFLRDKKVQEIINQAAWTGIILALAVGGVGFVAATYFNSFFLTAVNFNLFGYSVAGIAGAEASAQIGVASLLAAAASNAVIYGFNIISDLVTRVKNSQSNAASSSSSSSSESIPSSNVNLGASASAGLSATAGADHQPPAHHPHPHTHKSTADAAAAPASSSSSSTFNAS